MRAGPPCTHEIKSIPKHLQRGHQIELSDGTTLYRAPNGLYWYKPHNADIAGFATEADLLAFINDNRPWRCIGGRF